MMENVIISTLQQQLEFYSCRMKTLKKIFFLYLNNTMLEKIMTSHLKWEKIDGEFVDFLEWLTDILPCYTLYVLWLQCLSTPCLVTSVLSRRECCTPAVNLHWSPK